MRIGTNKLYLTRKSYLFTDHCFDKEDLCKDINSFIQDRYDLGPRLWHRWPLDTCRRVIHYVVLGSLGRHGSKRRTPIPRRQSAGSVSVTSGVQANRAQFFINRPLPRRQLNVIHYQTKLENQMQPTENQ